MSQTQDLKSQVSTLVDAVKALAMGWKDKAIAQAKPKAKSAGILGGAFGGAAYLAVKAFWLLLLAAILALVGRSQIPELKKKVDIGDDVKIGAETVKSGIEKGKAEVTAELDGVHTPELDLR